MKFASILLLFLLLSVVPFYQELEERIDRLIVEDFEDFSGVVGVMDSKGEVVANLSYGYSDVAANISNSDTTRFGLASLSKVFTMVAILKLAEEGRLSLEDSIGHFFTGFEDKRANTITIRNLLAHRAGWGHYWDDSLYMARVGKIGTHVEFLDLIKPQPLRFDPGENYRYGNSNYIVLGAIVEKVTGQSFEAVITKGIFEPCTMFRAGLTGNEQLVAQPMTSTNIIPAKSSRGWADGGAYASMPDLFRFAKHLFVERELLATPSFDQLMSGFGYESEDYFEIQGGFPGVSTLLAYDEQTGMTLVLLSNQDPPIANSIGQKIVQLLVPPSLGEDLLLAGKVVDKTTNEPIPYVNIGIFEKKVGTASNELGIFKLPIPGAFVNQALTFSAIGFQREEQFIAELISSDSLTVYLVPKEEELDEVIIYSERLKKVVMGPRIVSPMASGAYIGGGKPGACLVTAFQFAKQPVYLHKVQVHTRSNRQEQPFKLRLRISEQSNGRPGEELLSKDWIVASTIKEGWIDFVFDDPIVLKSDVFVGVEWIEEPDNQMSARNAYPRISYVPRKRSGAFVRTTSLDVWKNISIKPMINIEVEF